MSDPTPCKGCGQPIVFVRSRANRAIPCDPPELQVVTDSGAVVKGRISHFATCPKSKDFRKPKAGYEKPMEFFQSQGEGDR